MFRKLDTRDLEQVHAGLTLRVSFGTLYGHRRKAYHIFGS